MTINEEGLHITEGPKTDLNFDATLPQASPPVNILLIASLDDADLTLAEHRIATRIARRGLCWESVPSMAKTCRMSENTVWATLKSLETKGIISRTARPGQTSIYALNPPRQWLTPTPKETVGNHGTHPKRDGGHPPQKRRHKEGTIEIGGGESPQLIQSRSEIIPANSKLPGRLISDDEAEKPKRDHDKKTVRRIEPVKPIVLTAPRIHLFPREIAAEIKDVKAVIASTPAADPRQAAYHEKLWSLEELKYGAARSPRKQAPQAAVATARPSAPIRLDDQVKAHLRALRDACDCVV